MSLNSRIQSVSELTSAQQQMLRIVLQIPAYTFRTSDIQARATDIGDGCAVGGVLSSLLRLGLLQRVAAGRDKEWCLTSEIRERQQELTLSLLAIKAVPDKKEHCSIDEVLAELKQEIG